MGPQLCGSEVGLVVLVPFSLLKIEQVVRPLVAALLSLTLGRGVPEPAKAFQAVVECGQARGFRCEAVRGRGGGSRGAPVKKCLVRGRPQAPLQVALGSACGGRNPPWAANPPRPSATFRGRDRGTCRLRP